MDHPTPAEIAEQAGRIAASKGFVSSDPARNLLLYLADHGLRHPQQPVKEFTLATEALGKGPDYDPRSDSAVRVVASRLRAKLAEYYTGEGLRDPISITLPKGTYALAGSYRAGDSAIRVEAPNAQGGIRRPARIIGPVLLVLAGALLGGLVTFLIAGRPSRNAVPAPLRVFWRHFTEGEPPIIVYSNPKFVGSPRTGLRLWAPGMKAGDPVNGLYTGIGEVLAVRDISRQLSALGKEAQVKRAQLFTWDDARSRDLVFAGGQEQNFPMSQLPPLEKFNLKPDSVEPFLDRGAVRNEKPAPGEEPYYFAGSDLDNGVEYAIAALTEGVTPNRRVLVLAGIHTHGTEGAAAFVCSADHMSELLRRLRVGDDGDVPPFEALLEVRVRGGAPLAPKALIVHRRGSVK